MLVCLWILLLHLLSCEIRLPYTTILRDIQPHHMDRHMWEKTQAPARGPVRLPAAATPTCQLVTEAILDMESPASVSSPNCNLGANTVAIV